MSHVQWRHEFSGRALFFTLRTHVPRFWNTSGTPNWEVYTVANWGAYLFSMSETPANGFFYVGSLPSIAGNMTAGWMWVDIFERIPPSASANVADYRLLGHMYGHWNGTVFRLHETDQTGLLPTTIDAIRAGLSTLTQAQVQTLLSGLSTLTESQVQNLLQTIPVDLIPATITTIRAGLSTLTEAQVQALLAGIQATVSQSDIDAIRAGLSTLTEAQVQALLAGISATLSPENINEIRANLSTLTIQQVEGLLAAALQGIPVIQPVDVTTRTRIVRHRGDTWDIVLANLGALHNVSDIWFTMKRTTDQTDSQADLQIRLTQGVVRGGTSTSGSIVIVDPVAGTSRIRVAPVITATLFDRYVFDVQVREATGDIRTVTEGEFLVRPDATHAIL